MSLRDFIAMFLCLMGLVEGTRAVEPPTTRPSVPPLIVEGGPPNVFMVRGIMRSNPNGGLGFYVATDGKRQVCALYDATDGTPLFLSDGQQTLVYDLDNLRVVRVPDSRGYIRVDWNSQLEKPLGFQAGVVWNSDPKRLVEDNSFFRLDRFVEQTKALKQIQRPGEPDSFVAEREGGITESVHIEPAIATRFRFTSKSEAESLCRLEVDATAIGAQLPKDALAFPDPSRLPADVNVTELDVRALPDFLRQVREGRPWITKIALNGGPQMREFVKEVVGDVDWQKVTERDKGYGAAYRRALAGWGVVFPARSKASTAPTE